MFGLEQIFRGYNALEVLFEMAVIWLFVYVIFRFLQGTRGEGVIKGVAILLVMVTVALVVLGEYSQAFGRLDYLYRQFISAVAILLIVVFQPELRRAMIRLGQTKLLRRASPTTLKVANTVAEAAEFLSKSQFGALIVLERSVRLGALVDSGVELDATISARLLQSIFYPNSPLHDLAVVIQGNRVAAANVQLPMVEGSFTAADRGSRHRAGVGISLETDCLSVIVSEETGSISIAEYGRLKEIPRERLRDELVKRLQMLSTEDESEQPAAVIESDAAGTDRSSEPEDDTRKSTSSVAVEEKHA